MVKINYKSDEEIKKERDLCEKGKKVKGLAKEVFGFPVVLTQSFDTCYLSSLLGFPFTFEDIASIDASKDKMKLKLPKYEERSIKFAEKYERMFGVPLTINADYSELKK